MQTGPGHIWNASKTNASDAFSIFLGGHDNQGLEFRTSADRASFLSAPVSFVHLDDAIQPVPSRTEPCEPDLGTRLPPWVLDAKAAVGPGMKDARGR